MSSSPRILGGRPVRPGASRGALLLFAASLALVLVTTGFAVAAAWRHRKNTQQLLRDYAAFAAWSYRQRLAESLEEAVWMTLNPIEHRQPHRAQVIPEARDLARYRETSLAQCQCDPGAAPRTYFRFGMQGDSLTTSGDSLPTPLDRELAPDLRGQLRQPGSPRRDGILRLSASSSLAAYGLMPTEWGDTIVYGFTIDSAALHAAFARTFHEGSLLPTAVTAGRPNEGLLSLEVRDTTGRTRYRDATWPDEREWPFIATESLPPRTGGLVVRLTVQPGAVPTFLAGGLPRTPIPLLMIVGLLGLGLSIAAVSQLRREGQLSRLRSDFVTAVSHELRTPLAQIRLFLDTLRLGRYDTDAQREWLLGHLVRETTRLEHLVENVLAISRLERGATGVVPRAPADLSQEVRDAVVTFEPLAASRRADLVTSVEPGLRVGVEREALRQLLLNLFDNAVKFGPPGQRIAVTVRAHDGHAELTVKDQGPGVPATERDRIWEPYYRGSGDNVRTVGGSGIGLAIVRDIAARAGGTSEVRSPPGGGAEFVIRLPRLEDGDRV